MSNATIVQPDEETPDRPQAAPMTPLRFLHNTQQSVEKFRIGVGNRVSAIERGADAAAGEVPRVYQILLDQALKMETTIDEAIADELKGWPVYTDWLCHVKGIGPSLAGQMLALLIPPRPEKGPSMWFKAAGLAPERRTDPACPLHGENAVPEEEIAFSDAEIPCTCFNRLPRPRAGEGKITYHPGLRRCLYNVATSFVRNGGYYREEYVRGKERLVRQHAGDDRWPPHRLDSVARWRTVKLFLGHLWEAYALAEGFTPRVPYVVEYMNHHLIPRPMPEMKEHRTRAGAVELRPAGKI